MKQNNNFVTITVTLTLLLSLNQRCDSSKVLELSDKFLDVKKDGGQWFVMFYAPWCGHCKRLEPIWAHVAQALYKTNIRVGRVDCTRFSNVANEFSIVGFPTIKFMKADKDYTFHGDRTTDEMVNFALRMSRPAVQEITRPDSFTSIRASDPVFFMYVGPREGPLWHAYQETAFQMQPYSFFYSAKPDLAMQTLEIENVPTVFVYKESTLYFFPDMDVYSDTLNGTLYNWINEERFQTFPKVTKGNIDQILQTKKYLVLVVVEENKLEEVPAYMVEFRDMVESVIRKHRNKYHTTFQFGWIGSPDLANSIAMTILPLPHLLVLNSTTNHHHLIEDEPTNITAEALHLFLERISNQSVPAYGGKTWTVRAYRAYFELKTALGDMWRGNPVLMTVLFGLPLGFLSLILYSICCSDILDAEEEEEEDLLHEKRE